MGGDTHQKITASLSLREPSTKRCLMSSCWNLTKRKYTARTEQMAPKACPSLHSRGHRNEHPAQQSHRRKKNTHPSSWLTRLVNGLTRCCHRRWHAWRRWRRRLSLGWDASVERLRATPYPVEERIHGTPRFRG